MPPPPKGFVKIRCSGSGEMVEHGVYHGIYLCPQCAGSVVVEYGRVQEHHALAPDTKEDQ